MKIVRFLGRPAHGASDSLATPPIDGIWYAGTPPTAFPDHVELFTEKRFDRAFAEQHGRLCGDDCDGDCWAEFFTATWNVNDEKNAPWFEVTDDPAAPIETTTTTDAQASTPTEWASPPAEENAE